MRPTVFPHESIGPASTDATRASAVADWPGGIPGIQSVEVGLDLFRHLTDGGAPCGLSDLARRAGMHRAKAYRYLVSLARAGWVCQDAQGRYDIGPAVRDLALAWLPRQDPLLRAGEEARAVAQALGETCFVAVRGQGGVTAVRVCQPGRGVSIGVAEGALFDLESSATGRIFAAWQEPGSGGLAADVLHDIRARGLAMVEGEHVPGINAFSVPVFDAQGQLLLALTLVGPAGSLRADPDSAAAQALCAAGRRVSAALGG